MKTNFYLLVGIVYSLYPLTININENIFFYEDKFSVIFTYLLEQFTVCTHYQSEAAVPGLSLEVTPRVLRDGGVHVQRQTQFLSQPRHSNIAQKFYSSLKKSCLRNFLSLNKRKLNFVDGIISWKKKQSANYILQAGGKQRESL